MLNNDCNREIIAKLQAKDKEKLVEALTKAVLNMYTFPKKIRGAIHYLQLDYKENNDAETILFIEKRVRENFSKIFELLTDNDFQESEWGDGFLMFLAKTLDITLEKDNIYVEAFIKSGKVYWRLINSTTKTPVYTRPHWIEDDTPRFLMPWEKFREFKDAGKRSGTVRVTEHLFAQQFAPCLQPFARAAWNELREKGILTPKNRLSESWRIISNEDIYLTIVTTWTHDIRVIFRSTDNYLNPQLAGQKEVFIGNCPDYYRVHAALIWEKYRANNYRKFTEKYIAECMGEVEFCLNYRTICSAIYSIINNAANQEVLPVFNLNIFRSERTIKTWAGTAKVCYSHEISTKANILDVGVYTDLTTHKPEPRYQGIKLERDHSPSFGIFHSFSVKVVKDYEAAVAEKKRCLESMKNNMKDTTPDALTATETELKLLGVIFEQIALETYGREHGPYWWAIVVPHLLHIESPTYGKLIEQQLIELNGQNPFLRDVTVYLDFIERNQEKAATTFYINSYLELLGALRHLYRSQTKYHGTLNEKYYVGLVPYLFFEASKDKPAIDALFTDRISKNLKICK